MKQTITVKLSPTQAHVLAILKGSASHIRRQEIQNSVFGTRRNKNNDRAIQRAIQELRDFGFAIVSNSSQPGYRLATSKAEVTQYVAERMKAARKMMKTAKRVERAYGLKRQMPLAGMR